MRVRAAVAEGFKGKQGCAMKKQISPWARIKREVPGVQRSYREKKKSRKWLFVLSGLLATALLLSVLRIPERLLQIGEPNTETSVPAMELTGVYNSLFAEIVEMEQEADWDGDGLKNGADPYPRDMDADRNGVSDGCEGKSVITGDLPIEYGNVRLIVSNLQSGVVYFRGEYAISAYPGWLAFSDETGTPYVLTDGKWTKAQFERDGVVCYVNVPGSCRIRFSDNGKPNDRDVLIEAVAAEYDNDPDERYSIANAPLSQIESIYDSVDNGKPVQISILTNRGEQILLIHGYDKYGNLIAADCNRFSEMGKVYITVKAQVFWDGTNISMRSWYEFEWGELSSANGDVITVF